MPDDRTERRLSEVEEAVHELIAALERTQRNPATDEHLQAARRHLNTAKQLRPEPND
jgi:hypothetical protein